jgi:hypothetical protein
VDCGEEELDKWTEKSTEVIDEEISEEPDDTEIVLHGVA